MTCLNLSVPVRPQRLVDSVGMHLVVASRCEHGLTAAPQLDLPKETRRFGKTVVTSIATCLVNACT